jgi:hypothetical protein
MKSENMGEFVANCKFYGMDQAMLNAQPGEPQLLQTTVMHK